MVYKIIVRINYYLRDKIRYKKNQLTDITVLCITLFKKD